MLKHHNLLRERRGKVKQQRLFLLHVFYKKHWSICGSKLCAVFAFYTCDSQIYSSLTTQWIQTDGNCRLGETLGGVPLLPSSPPPSSTSSIEIVHWCKTCWAGVSMYLPSLPRGSTTLNIAPPPPSTLHPPPPPSPPPPSLPPLLLFLIGSHLCILVTQSAPSPPEPAGQEAQALRVPTAGV